MRDPLTTPSQMNICLKLMAMADHSSWWPCPTVDGHAQLMAMPHSWWSFQLMAMPHSWWPRNECVTLWLHQVKWIYVLSWWPWLTIPVDGHAPHANWRNDTEWRSKAASLCNNSLVFLCVEAFTITTVSGLLSWVRNWLVKLYWLTLECFVHVDRWQFV